MKPTGLARRWFLWNAAAWLTAFVLYTPIAHGVTGGHPGGLTPRQIAAHSVGHTVVALIIAAAQRRALRPEVSVSWIRLPAAAVAYNVLFWIGSYQTLVIGPDVDILLGFLALGSAVWIGNVPATGHRMAALIAILIFSVASVIAELGLIGIAALLGITPDLQTSIVQHSMFWITVGGVSGILGGWVSGIALERMVPATVRHRAAQRGLAADAASLRG
jgi:hypothetical protein